MLTSTPPSPFVVAMPFVVCSSLMALDGRSVWGVGFSGIVLAEPEPCGSGVYCVDFWWAGVAVAYVTGGAEESGRGLRAAWRPRRCIGWLGFAQGVCSRNCCSDDDVVAAAAAAEVDRADAVVGLVYVVAW